VGNGTAEYEDNARARTLDAMLPDDLQQRLKLHPNGLILLSGENLGSLRRALWDALGSRCDTLYWIGPLPEKPFLEGETRCWLLECPLAERYDGLMTVLRRDPHAIHIIGPAEGPLVDALVRAALAGCVCVAEVEAATPADALARFSRLSREPGVLRHAVVASLAMAPGGIVSAPLVWTSPGS